MQAATAESMRDYYARRAATYERVYFKTERQADLRALEAWLGGPFAGREVLEIACGTGWWTPHGAVQATSWLATDLNPETLALARATSIPVIASGGLASMADIERLMKPDAQILEGAITGRALYDGRLDPKAALGLLAQARQG